MEEGKLGEDMDLGEQTKRQKKFEVNYTVGRIEDGNAILLSTDHKLT